MLTVTVRCRSLQFLSLQGFSLQHLCLRRQQQRSWKNCTTNCARQNRSGTKRRGHCREGRATESGRTGCSHCAAHRTATAVTVQPITQPLCSPSHRCCFRLMLESSTRLSDSKRSSKRNCKRWRQSSRHHTRPTKRSNHSAALPAHSAAAFSKKQERFEARAWGIESGIQEHPDGDGMAPANDPCAHCEHMVCVCK